LVHRHGRGAAGLRVTVNRSQPLPVTGAASVTEGAGPTVRLQLQVSLPVAAYTALPPPPPSSVRPVAAGTRCPPRTGPAATVTTTGEPLSSLGSPERRAASDWHGGISSSVIRACDRPEPSPALASSVMITDTAKRHAAASVFCKLGPPPPCCGRSRLRVRSEGPPSQGSRAAGD